MGRGHEPWRHHAAEAFGTFALVFFGTGAIVVNQAHDGVIGHMGIALTFGLVVMAMIYTFGDVSGAHLNPAVTLGLTVAGRFPKKEVPGYVLSQILGALVASLILRFLIPESGTLGITLPSGTESQSFILEVLLTAVLMLVILHVTVAGREKALVPAIAIGAVVGLEAMVAGPVCGASMNPARSLAPAVVSGHLEHLWIYLTATVLGALLAGPLYRLSGRAVEFSESALEEESALEIGVLEEGG